MAEIVADHIEIERRPHDHRAVAAIDRDDVVRTKAQAAEQVVKITEADRSRDHTEKAAVGAGDAAAEHDGVGATMQHRAAQEQAGIGPVAVNPEILFIGAIFRDRIQRRGVDDQPALGVEHLDGAEMLGGRGVVEQDQVPDRRADLLDFRQLHAAGDGPQRQVIEFDVAADFGVDTGSQVFKGLARQFLFAVTHVEHDVGADRGKADDGGHGGRDQQFCR